MSTPLTKEELREDILEAMRSYCEDTVYPNEAVDEILRAIGFTREDVRWLRGICDAIGPTEQPIGREKAVSLADRLEALLPPEDGE
jgi:hypothetical protein